MAVNETRVPVQMLEEEALMAIEGTTVVPTVIVIELEVSFGCVLQTELVVS